MFLWLFFKTQHAIGMVFSGVFPKGFSIGLEKHQKKGIYKLTLNKKRH